MRDAGQAFPFVRGLFVGGFALALLAAWACDGRRADLTPYVAQAQANPTITANALASDWRGGRLTFEQVLNEAHALCDAGDPRAVAFAESVLRLAVLIESDLPSGGEFEIFWRRVGRLAFNGAWIAFQAGEHEAARRIVLAGPSRWRTDAYFRRYDDHNALASVILNNAGDRREAIERLRRQPALGTEARGVLDRLEGR